MVVVNPGKLVLDRRVLPGGSRSFDKLYAERIEDAAKAEARLAEARRNLQEVSQSGRLAHGDPVVTAQAREEVGVLATELRTAEQEVDRTEIVGGRGARIQPGPGEAHYGTR